MLKHVKTTAASQWPMIIGQWDALKADIGVMNSSRDEWHQLKHPGSVVCLLVDFPSVNFFSFTQYTNCSNLFFPLPCRLPWTKKTWWGAKMSISSVKMPWHLDTFDVTPRWKSKFASWRSLLQGTSFLRATNRIQLEFLLHRLKDSLEQGVDYTFSFIYIYIYVFFERET